jgi:hypothetical protein
VLGGDKRKEEKEEKKKRRKRCFVYRMYDSLLGYT